MNAIYASTKGDSVINLAQTLEIEGYGVGVIEVYGKTKVPAEYKNKTFVSLFRLYSRHLYK